MPTKSAAIDPNRIADPFFRDIAARILHECVAHYDNRLAAVYVHGSVHRNEAVRGASDVDVAVFLRGDFTDADSVWRKSTNDILQIETPEVGWHWIPPAQNLALFDAFRQSHEPGSDDWLRGRGWTHLIRDDATRIFGDDLAADLPQTFCNNDWASARFSTPRNSVRVAAGFPPIPDTPEAAEEATWWPLPAELRWRLRKLARLAVLGGAYYLMTKNRFVSYAGRNVLPTLRAELSAWSEFFANVERLYILPLEDDTTTTDDILPDLVRWMDWVANHIR